MLDLIFQIAKKCRKPCKQRTHSSKCGVILRTQSDQFSLQPFHFYSAVGKLTVPVEFGITPNKLCLALRLLLDLYRCLLCGHQRLFDRLLQRKIMREALFGSYKPLVSILLLANEYFYLLRYLIQERLHLVGVAASHLLLKFFLLDFEGTETHNNNR